MQNKISIVLASVLVLIFLSSCGVSQAEYDKVVAERDALQALLDTTETQDNTDFEDDDQEDSDSSDSTSAQPLTPISHTMIGEMVTTDTLNITLLDCTTMERVYESSISYYEASEGMMYAILPFRLENTSMKDEQVSSHFDFKYYADNVLCQSVTLGYWPPNVGGYPAIDSDDVLAAGRAIEGYVACEVPLDAQVLEIEYEGFIFECALS